jgi:hypothetical protein
MSFGATIVGCDYTRMQSHANRHQQTRLAHTVRFVHQQKDSSQDIPLAPSELEGLGNGREDGGVPPRVLGGEGERVLLLLST